MITEIVRTRIADCTRACHIKLGNGNGLAEECTTEGTIYIGYYTDDDTLELLRSGGSERWERLRAKVQDEYPDTLPANLTSAINQMSEVIDDDGSTLWFTFFGTRMYWTFIDPTSQTTSWKDGSGGRRNTLGWSCEDVNGQEIQTSSITTRISQVQAYQRTVRAYGDKEDADAFNPVAYLRHRLRGEQQPVAIATEKCVEQLKGTCEKLIQRLTDKEFENFVDLIFIADGWLRQTEVGGQMKDIDGEYVHATTGYVAKVQVKSRTKSDIIVDSALWSSAGPSTLLYWVFHSEDDPVLSKLEAYFGAPEWRADVPWFRRSDRAGTMLVLGVQQLSQLAIKKGLVHWLLSKAS